MKTGDGIDNNKFKSREKYRMRRMQCARWMHLYCTAQSIIKSERVSALHDHIAYLRQLSNRYVLKSEPPRINIVAARLEASPSSFKPKESRICMYTSLLVFNNSILLLLLAVVTKPKTTNQRLELKTGKCITVIGVEAYPRAHSLLENNII